MSYDIQTWINDSLSTVLNAPRLSHIETGIKQAADIADQALAAAATVNSGIPGAVYFDTFFAGASDSAKITTMNTWAQSMAGSPTPVVFFAARTYNFTTPIKLFSGLKLAGSAGFAAREFSRGTIFNWQGASGTSLLIYPPEGQTGQSYPSDGSPRDITMTGIQFQGGASTHWMPKLSPSQFTGTTLWYCQFHNCGWKNMNTVWWGAGTGTSISGQTHFQSVGNTALYVGGSECSFFGDDAYSFAADANPTAGTPFMRSTLAKSHIGRVMITSRQVNYMLSIEGGHNLHVGNMAIDTQSSDPLYGAGIKISGGDGIVLDGISHKGVATTPASGSGGASANRGWIHITGGRQITVMNNQFHREGNNMPATSYPLMYVGTGANEVKWGLNNYSNFGGSTAVIQQAVSGKIFAVADPSVSIVTAA